MATNTVTCRCCLTCVCCFVLWMNVEGFYYTNTFISAIICKCIYFCRFLANFIKIILLEEMTPRCWPFTMSGKNTWINDWDYQTRRCLEYGTYCQTELKKWAKCAKSTGQLVFDFVLKSFTLLRGKLNSYLVAHLRVTDCLCSKCFSRILAWIPSR